MRRMCKDRRSDRPTGRDSARQIGVVTLNSWVIITRRREDVKFMNDFFKHILSRAKVCDMESSPVMSFGLAPKK